MKVTRFFQFVTKIPSIFQKIPHVAVCHAAYLTKVELDRHDLLIKMDHEASIVALDAVAVTKRELKEVKAKLEAPKVDLAESRKEVMNGEAIC